MVTGDLKTSRGGLEHIGITQIQVQCPMHSVVRIPLGSAIYIDILNKKE